MWRFADDTATSPRQIEAVISRLIGDEAAAAFWQRFREDYFTEDDVEAIAGYGYNSSASRSTRGSSSTRRATSSRRGSR